MPNLSKLKAKLTGGGADLKVVATSTGLDIQATAPAMSTVGARLKVGFGSGAGANNDITITGISTTSKLVTVLEIQPPTATSGNTLVADRTSQTSITAANTIRISQSTSGNQVLVFWWD